MSKCVNDVIKQKAQNSKINFCFENGNPVLMRLTVRKNLFICAHTNIQYVQTSSRKNEGQWQNVARFGKKKPASDNATLMYKKKVNINKNKIHEKERQRL